MEEDNGGGIQQNTVSNNSRQGTGFGVQNVANSSSATNDSGSVTDNNGIVNNNINSNNAGKVVSLKGGLTKKEIEEQKRIEELKKRAVKLERKLTPKEKELERMHQKAVKPAMFTVSQKSEVKNHKVAKPDNFSNHKNNSDELSNGIKNSDMNSSGVSKKVDVDGGNIDEVVTREQSQIEAVESLINPIEEKKQDIRNKKQDTRNKTQDTKNKIQGVIVEDKIAKQVGRENNKTPRVSEMENDKNVETNSDEGDERKFQGVNRRMVISPSGQISYVDEPNNNNKGSKDDSIDVVSSKRVEKIKNNSSTLNNLDGQRNITQSKRGLSNDMFSKKTTMTEGHNNLKDWEDKKVDLKGLPLEKRLDVQATPVTASVSWKMDEDTNGMVVDWFRRYDELPANIKLGLSDSEIRREIISLADILGIKNEENLGEIARIVRDIYVDLIKGNEVKERLIKKLKIPQDKIDEVIKQIAKIVAKVKTIGNKKSEDYYEKITIKEAIAKYPKVAQQEISKAVLFDKNTGKTKEPTIQNWIDDYINFAGSGIHTNLERGKYLVDAKSVKNLDKREKQCLEHILESYDNNKNVLIDEEEKYLMCWLHTDESKLGINSDKNKRVINKFKIEEAQTTGIGIENQDLSSDSDIQNTGEGSNKNNQEENNLENNDNKGIIKDVTNKDKIENNLNNAAMPKDDNDRENFLDLSSEIPVRK